MAEIVLAGGGNLNSRAGAPRQTLTAALKMLADGDVILDRQSSFWRTRPVPVSEQPDFINLVAVAQTSLRADEVITLFHSVEQKLGRQRGERWQARTLDLDLLGFGDEVRPDHTDWQRQIDPETQETALLCLPHPRLHLRRFVLAPLVEIYPHWRHPVLGRSARSLLDDLPADQEQVQRLDD